MLINIGQVNPSRRFVRLQADRLVLVCDCAFVVSHCFLKIASLSPNQSANVVRVAHARIESDRFRQIVQCSYILVGQKSRSAADVIRLCFFGIQLDGARRICEGLFRLFLS